MRGDPSSIFSRLVLEQVAQLEHPAHLVAREDAMRPLGFEGNHGNGPKKRPISRRDTPARQRGERVEVKSVVRRTAGNLGRVHYCTCWFPVLQRRRHDGSPLRLRKKVARAPARATAIADYARPGSLCVTAGRFRAAQLRHRECALRRGLRARPSSPHLSAGRCGRSSEAGCRTGSRCSDQAPTGGLSRPAGRP